MIFLSNKSGEKWGLIIVLINIFAPVIVSAIAFLCILLG